MANPRKRHKKKKRKPVSIRAVVDIVIPVHGRFDLLKECLEAIPGAANSVPYRVIIVDNASDKEPADEFYAQWRSNREITILRNRANKGFAAACNQGASNGHSPLIFLLNSDCIMLPESIKALVKRMDDPSIAVCGAKLLFPLSSEDPHRPAGKLQHVGLATNINGEIIHLFVGWSPEHPKVRAVDEVLAVTGAALMTRRTVWTEARGLDAEKYGIGTYEDVDFCLKAAMMGRRNVVCQDAVGIHHVGASAIAAQIPFPLQQNAQKFLEKWAEALPYSHWHHV